VKRSVGLIVILGIITVAGIIFLTSPKLEKVKDLVETALPAQTKTPYSVQWGSTLARVVGQDGKGVAAATVTFTKYLARDCDGKITEQPPAWQGSTVKTNEKGEFAYPPQIWQIEEGKEKPSIDAKIEAAGFLPRTNVSIGINYSDDTGLIDIFRIGRIEGVLMDPNGQPIADAPVWISPYTQYTNPGNSCSGCYSANVTTDKNGSFVFDKVPPGQHIIKFPGHTGGCDPNEKTIDIPFKDYAAFATIAMKDGQVKSDVFLDLRANQASITGKVVDEYNRPVAGVNAVLTSVIKLYNKHGYSTHTGYLNSVLTDENGVYILKHIPAGDYQIQAQYPHEKGKSYKSGDPLNICLAGSQDIVFNLVLKRQDDSLPRPSHGSKPLFEVPLKQDLGPREMMITDPQGNGIANASVVFGTAITAADHASGKKTTDWKGASLTTDSRGIFLLPQAIAEIEGKWVECPATIKAEGFEKRQVSLSSHLLKNERRIDILPLGVISGQLIGLDGQPVKGAAVSLRDQMTAHRNPGSTMHSSGEYGSINTDKDGRFELQGVPEGTHTLEYKVFVPDKKKDLVNSFIVYTQGGKSIDNLVIDLLQDTCTAHGRVLDLDGRPVKKASVRLSKSIQWGHAGFGASTVSREQYRSDPTGRTGNYSIENVRPGVYEIQAVLEGEKQRTSDKMTIAVSDGQAIELDIQLKP
jgi:uncharacterized GH25 family protein